MISAAQRCLVQTSCQLVRLSRSWLQAGRKIESQDGCYIGTPTAFREGNYSAGRGHSEARPGKAAACCTICFTTLEMINKTAVLDRAAERVTPGGRLVQAAFHNRSLSLYASLGFYIREPLSFMQGHPLQRSVPGCEARPARTDDVNRQCYFAASARV